VAQQGWVDRLGAIVARFGVVALPTLPIRPPLVDELSRGFNSLTSPVNLAGFPAISLPVPAEGRPPTGLQLIGPPGGEELLCAVALRVEAAVAR
jgi:Asp-tRNA(Asn)/Glu-tRNA(Gln) amidotransferase A subunit family amidase